MNPENRFTLTEDQIFAAEKQRAMGNNAQAAQATSPAIEFPLEKFIWLPEKDKKLLLMASRINVVANNNRANESMKAHAVAHYLAETRKGIVLVYRNPDIQEAIGIIKQDTRGNPYEFRIEMARDEIEYTLTLAALTGNTDLLNTAIDRMSQIIGATQEPSAKTLAQFKKDRLEYYTNETKRSFTRLKQAYQKTTKASEKINLWKSSATVASRYAIDASSTGHPIEALKGVARYARAAIYDRSTIRILPGEIAKTFQESARHKNWRRTILRDADYSRLRLPQPSS